MPRRVATTMVVAVLTASMLGPGAQAAHYCTGLTGTLVTVTLPDNPVDPARTHLYIHDRARTTGTGTTGNPLDAGDDTEGTWIYLENGKKPGYQLGGSWIVLGLHSDGAACGGPNRYADDLIL